jgi:hypothetical protein
MLGFVLELAERQNHLAEPRLREYVARLRARPAHARAQAAA